MLARERLKSLAHRFPVNHPLGGSIVRHRLFDQGFRRLAPSEAIATIPDDLQKPRPEVDPKLVRMRPSLLHRVLNGVLRILVVSQQIARQVVGDVDMVAN